MTTVRSLLALGAALALGLAGPGCDAAGAPDGGADGATDGGAFRVVGFTDLPSADPRSHELSGLGWDEGAQTLWAVTNGAARLHRLLPDADFTGFTLADGLAVTGAGPWDGEGLARAAAGFYCANELGPAVLPVDGAGAAGAGIALPAHFAQARSNKSLESLSLSPDGRTLFTMNEAALSSDGPLATATGGTRLRLLRVELTTGAQTERAYLTDPLPGAGGGSLGVSDIAALSATRVIVMERGFEPGVGNSARLFRVDIDQGPEVIAEAALSDAIAVLPKELLLDLAALPGQGFPEPPEPQPTRVLANYEGIALGPTLADGTRLLFLVSDDNSRSSQLARVLVLGTAAGL